jgi:CubicO group peptidase (beta-lactamase class C family)
LRGDAVTVRPVEGIEEAVDRLAHEHGFSGVVRVDTEGETRLARAYGLAHRGLDVANTLDTQFGIASGTKGLTALTVVSLIEAGRLDLATTARTLLGDDLPLIGDDVTVEHLLAHRSGIGDYLDEDLDLDFTEYLLTVPAHELETTEKYLRALDGYPAKFAPGERFSYCNSGFVVLALLAERATGMAFDELVETWVCGPAGMADTAFLRSDELPGRAAVGYLGSDNDRTNVFYLPVRGSGDGGIYTTVADIHALWAALFAGRIVSPDWVTRMTQPVSDAPADAKRYGLGFWLLATGPAVNLVGADAGVSFHSVYDPDRGMTHTVISNSTDGAWPIARHFVEALAT